MNPDLKSKGLDTDGKAPEILLMFNTFAVGGTEKHVLGLIGPLMERGWRVSVCGILGDGTLRAAFEKTGATIISLSNSNDGNRKWLAHRIWCRVRAAFHLLSVLRSRRPRIIHFFLAEALLVGGPIAILARTPIKIRSRRSLNYYRFAHPISWRLERALHSRMTAVLGNSRSVVAQLRDEECIPTSRLGLIYNGIDTSNFIEQNMATNGRALLGLKPTTLALIMVANLIVYKGHADLLDALVLAKSRLVPDWRLFIVGRDGGIGGQLRAQVCSFGLEENVIFLGERTDVPVLMSACDIGLSCSHEESFSNAILEGMAAGLAMIVTDVGGNSEAVGDGEAGLIVPAHDPQQLAEAIVRLSDDSALRAKLAATGRRRVAERFTLVHCADSYDRLYRALLQGKLPKDLPEIAAKSS